MVSGTSQVNIDWVDNFAVVGATYTYTVELLNKPCANVDIAVASGDTAKLTIDSGATLNFTPLDYAAKTVTLTVVSATTEGETVTITHTATSTDAGFNGTTPDFVGTTGLN